MDYKRLPGKKSGFFRKSTLWLGKDHLLAVESNYFTETYRHFPLKEIQAITLRRTPKLDTYYTISAALLLFFGISLYVCLLARHWIFLGVVTAPGIAGSLIFLFVNSIKGPTCSCVLKMPFADHDLPSLCRLKLARKALELLRPAVMEHQRGVRRQEEDITVEGSPSGLADAGYTPAESPRLPERRQARSGGKLHTALFGLLLVSAASRFGLIYPSAPTLSLVFNWIVEFALFAVIVIALVRQHGQTLAPTVKSVVWSALIFCVASDFFGYFYGFFFLIRHRLIRPFMTRYDILCAIARSGVWRDPLMLKANVCFIAGTAALALWGLGATMAWRVSRKRDPHSAIRASFGNTA